MTDLFDFEVELDELPPDVHSCALGPCDLSKERNGDGCYLCDTVAKLPQPPKRQREMGDADDQQSPAAEPVKKKKGKPKK